VRKYYWDGKATLSRSIGEKHQAIGSLGTIQPCPCLVLLKQRRIETGQLVVGGVGGDSIPRPTSLAGNESRCELVIEGKPNTVLDA